MTQSKSEQVLMNMEIRNNLTMMTPYQLYPCTSYDGYYISLKVWNVRSFRYVTIDCEKESCCKMVIPVLELNTIDIPERFNLEKSCLLPKNFFCREMPDKQLTIYLIGTYAETIKWTSLKDKIINVGNFRTSIPLKRGNRYSSIDRQCSILVDMFNDPTIQNIFSTEHLQSGDVSDKTGQFFSFEELYLHSTFSYNQCHDALISFTDEWTPPNNFHFNTSASSDEQVEGETQTEIQRPQVKLPCFQSIWKHSMAYDKTNVCNVHDDEMDYTMAIADEPGTSFDQQTSYPGAVDAEENTPDRAIPDLAAVPSVATTTCTITSTSATAVSTKIASTDNVVAPTTTIVAADDDGDDDGDHLNKLRKLTTKFIGTPIFPVWESSDDSDHPITPPSSTTEYLTPEENIDQSMNLFCTEIMDDETDVEYEEEGEDENEDENEYENEDENENENKDENENENENENEDENENENEDENEDIDEDIDEDMGEGVVEDVVEDMEADVANDANDVDGHNSTTEQSTPPLQNHDNDDKKNEQFQSYARPTDNQRSNHTNFQQINIHNEIGRLDISNSIINVFNIYNISNIQTTNMQDSSDNNGR